MESVPVLQGFHPDSLGFLQSISATPTHFMQ
jgi:hypothetical protein